MTSEKAKAALRTLAFLAVSSFILSGLSIFVAFPFPSAVAADGTRPTISITAPSDGATVSGAVQWTVQASDNVGVNSVMFFIDGKTYAVTFSAPYYTNVATAALSNGPHTWLAIAYDAAGNEARAQITVTTNNFDTAGPITTILKPLTGTTVSGTVDYRVRATDINGVTKVEFYVDSALVGTDTTPVYDSGTNTISQYAVSWNSASVPNSSHTLTAKSYDRYNNIGTRIITVTVSNGGDGSDTTPPAAPVISSPASGTVTKDNTPTFTGTAEASSIVKLYDGSSKTAIATTTASSTGTWSATTSTLSNGAHSITAKATDKAGNISPSSSSKSITIDTIAPSTLITSPSQGDRVRGTVTISVSATDNIKVSKVEFYVDGSLKGTDTTSSYSFSLNTSNLKNGGHTLMVKAFDSAGNTDSDTIRIKVVG